MIEIERLTDCPKHHFFGFHDLKAWNRQNDKILCLEVDTINRPPLPQEQAGVGYIGLDKKYIKLGATNAFNYPQGARMQWIGNTGYFVVNNQVGYNWGADVYDTSNNSHINSLPTSVHCLSSDGRTAFTLNYSRLFRLGVYGYIGVADAFAHEIAPAKDGIFVQDIQTKKSNLLVSIAEVANYRPLLSPRKGFHHYVTHLVLNPACTRLAFLHRYRLHDGGEVSRLMTIGIDGKNLRLLASGFLSHFDWISDDDVVIYGRAGDNKIDLMRNNPIFANPLVGWGIRFMKNGLRLMKPAIGSSQTSFLKIRDDETAENTPFAKGIFNSDGHPMFNPHNRDWLINDTYPDRDGIRTLMLYQVSTNIKIDLGTFRKIDDLPDMTRIEEYTQGVDPKILRLFSPELYSFTRSGLHCDLHPRWDAIGEKVSFDSIHEGTRQLYVCRIKNLIS